jgi:hypothetical protein
MEPEIENGYSSIIFYSYSDEISEVMEESLKWIKLHPEFDLEDIVAGSDEGTYVRLYGKFQG